jgi:hypothetical protein
MTILLDGCPFGAIKRNMRSPEMKVKKFVFCIIIVLLWRWQDYKHTVSVKYIPSK